MSRYILTNEMRQARESMRWTQEETAKMLEVELDKSVPLTTYQKWEQGILSVDTNDALLLCRFFKVQPKQMLIRKEKDA